MAKIWVFNDDENNPFQFSPSFHSQQTPEVACYQVYSLARRGGTSAGGLPIVFMSMHMYPIYMTPISILMQARHHLIPMFSFSLSTLPIVHLSTSLSLGRRTHFLTQACRNQASSTTPVFLSFLIRMSHIQNPARPPFHLFQMFHIRNPCPTVIPPEGDFCPAAIPNSGCLTSGILPGHYFTFPDVSHPKTLPPPPFPSLNVSHPESCPATISPFPDVSHPEPLPRRHSARGRFLSGRHSLLRMPRIRNSILPTSHLLRMSHIRRLTPDGRGGRSNFPCQACPDPRFITSFFKPFQSILSFILRVFKITQESHFQ